MSSPKNSVKRTAFEPQDNSTVDSCSHEEEPLESAHLAFLFASQGKLVDAEEMYQLALQGYEKTAGPDHISTITMVNNLGAVYGRQNKLDDAEKMYQRALQGYEKTVGLQHQSTLDTTYNLGVLYFHQGKLADSDEMYQRTLRGYKNAFGPDHISTLDATAKLGLLYFRQGKEEIAEEMYHRALEGYQKTLGLDHQSALDTASNLARLYFHQRKLVEAEIVCKQALERLEKLQSPSQESILDQVWMLGTIHAFMGKPKEAEAELNMAVEGYGKLLGPYHMSTLESSNNLAAVYCTQGRLEEAELKYTWILAGFEAVLGPDHDQTLRAASNLRKTQKQRAEAEANMDPQTCQICHALGLCLNGSRSTEVVKLHDLKESARNGCSDCSLLSDGLARCIPDLDTLCNVAVRNISTNSSQCLQLVVEASGDWQTIIDFFTIKESDGSKHTNSLDRFGYASMASGHTGSDQSFRTVRRWLLECERHKLCNRNVEKSLPKRVLDLEGLKKGNLLRLSEEPKEIGAYACLSHCWGKFSVITSKVATLRQRKDGIAFSDLPKTFQDAVTFTRKLGIRYLWIDSLCIIQDDEDDWSQEAAKMCQYYQRAYVTLAATMSADSQGGLFSGASPDSQAHCLRSSDQGICSNVYVRRHITHWNHDSSKFPLLNRAWVLQERLLSARVIHFGTDEIFWECLEDTICECSTITDRLEIDFPIKSQSKLRHAKALGSSSRNELAGQWHEIVGDYTSLGLTKDEDIFPALSGIAQQMQDVIKSRYLAGLWEDNLAADLLWRVDAPPDGRLNEYRAPSWSWASTKAPVQYDFNQRAPLQHLITIIKAECYPAHPSSGRFDPTGKLDSAYIIIEGQIISARYIAYSKEQNTVGLAHKESRFWEDEPNLFFFKDYDLDAKGDGHVPLGSNLCCLRVALSRALLHRVFQYWMVLIRNNNKDNEYRRIGLIWLASNVDLGATTASIKIV